jgi:hypothetical protein
MFAYFRNRDTLEIVGIYICGARWHESPGLRFFDRIPANKKLTRARKIGAMRCYEINNFRMVCLNRSTICGYCEV